MEAALRTTIAAASHAASAERQMDEAEKEAAKKAAVRQARIEEKLSIVNPARQEQRMKRSDVIVEPKAELGDLQQNGIDTKNAMLEQRIEELVAKDRDREQKITELTEAAASRDTMQKTFIGQLEKLCLERGNKILQCQGEAAESARQVVMLKEEMADVEEVRMENNTLLQRAIAAETNAAQLAKTLEECREKFSKTLELEKQTLRNEMDEIKTEKDGLLQRASEAEAQLVELMERCRNEKPSSPPEMAEMADELETLRSRLTEEYEAKCAMIQEEAIQREKEMQSSLRKASEKQILEFTNAATSRDAAQKKFIHELEKMCIERESKCAQLQLAMSQAEQQSIQLQEEKAQEADAEKQALLKRAEEATAKVDQATKTLDEQRSQLTKKFEDEKEELKARLEDSMKLMLDSTEKEKSDMHILSDQLAQAEMKIEQLTKQFKNEKEQLTKTFEARTEALPSEHTKELEAKQPSNAPHLNEPETEIQSELNVTVQTLTEHDSSPMKVGAPSPQRKLSHNEFRAFRQRLAASDNRAIAAEAKRSEVEQELVRQLSEQRQSFTKEIEDMREKMLQSEEALSAMKTGTTSESEEKIRRLSQENNDLRCQLTSIWTCINEQSTFIAKDKLSAQTDGEVCNTHPKVVDKLPSQPSQEVLPAVSRDVRGVVCPSPTRTRMDTPPRVAMMGFGPVACRMSPPPRTSRHEVCVASPRRHQWQVPVRATSRHLDL